LRLLVLAVVVVLFLGTGRDHAGLTVFTLSGTDVAPLRDVIVAASIAYIVLVLVVSPFELLAHARSATRTELLGRFAYLFLLLTFGFSLIYYDLGSKQLWSPNDLSHVSALYVTLGTIASNGFAGIEPKSDWLRGGYFAASDHRSCSCGFCRSNRASAVRRTHVSVEQRSVRPSRDFVGEPNGKQEASNTRTGTSRPS
jgi:hypothetical protein